MDWLKCNICFNTYDESSLRPRSLSCGHTFCEKCINNTIQNETLTCPQCRKVQEIRSALGLPVNFTLEGLLKTLNTCSQDVSEGTISREIQGESNTKGKKEMHTTLKSFLEQKEENLSSQKNLLKMSAGMCNEHTSNECMFRCSLHMCWVCKQCVEEEGDHPKNKCKITSYKEEIEDRRQIHKKTLNNEGKSCDKTITVLERYNSYLKNEKAHHMSMVKILQELVDVHKKEEQTLQNEMISFKKMIEDGKNLKQILIDVEVTILNAVSLDESNTARDIVKQKKAETRRWINCAHREIDEGKREIENSNSRTKKTWEVLQQKIENNVKKSDKIGNLIEKNKLEDIDCTENNLTQGVECRKELPVGGLFYSCLQCRIHEDVLLCGSCFVNSTHYDHETEIYQAEFAGEFCDCGITEMWKKESSCLKHSNKDNFPLKPFNETLQLSCKCKEVFIQGEYSYCCLDCSITTDNDAILCGTCFSNSSHKYHKYEISTILENGAFCDCGCKEAWKMEDTCNIHNSINPENLSRTTRDVHFSATPSSHPRWKVKERLLGKKNGWKKKYAVKNVDKTYKNEKI